ncbi:MAG: histidine kinase [Actinomycetota bacterium]|nr:histidine kinase [Actinomycetota bacterium]
MKEPLWRSRRESFYYMMPIVVLAVVHVLAYAFEGLPTTWPSWLDLAVNITLMGLLVVRKWYPVMLMIASIALATCYILLMAFPTSQWFPELNPNDPWISLTAMVYAYNVMIHAGAVVGPAMVGVLAAVVARPWEWSSDVVLGMVFTIVVPALIGLYIRTHRGMVQALTDRAERAEREQHLLTEQARTDERVRLAEEMHDVVTHRVSLMVLHAGALGVTAPDEHTRTAAEGLRQAGCEALNELRELVGVLRNDAEQGGPRENSSDGTPVAVPDLSTLVSESESVGVPVELVEEGNRSLTSPTVGRTAYRVVQEALTNIRKHAPGAPTKVHIRYTGDRVRVTIRNLPPTHTLDNGLSSTGSGTGLRGLRHRVELVGGHLNAGPRPGGGFEVDAILPAYVPAAESS